jgi:putative SOS response-associated peptidase YedK
MIDSPPLFTFSIVTVPARADMEWLHDRMPLIFSPTSQDDMERLKLWLDPTKGFRDGIRRILELYQHDAPAEPFTIYQGIVSYCIPRVWLIYVINFVNNSPTRSRESRS